ncbi:MAG: choice-of-anchor I family protein [Bacteroidia bacterium]|nr:choice-of-anchor I family protein [Bacteroidia bacterium]
MKKLLTSLATLCICAVTTAQNGPGLIISEALPNPAGTDSPFEFVELLATRTINFAVTPYTVVVCNNGAANAQGWVAGGTLSYAFEISTGTVNAGDVVYVGGSSMAATGTILRSINTGSTAGDGFGTAASGGVFGNGGANADGIAVFSQPVASLTAATVPVDALFFGTSTGTAVVNAGADGYQLPVSDLYAGGKLQSSSFLAPDPASAQTLTATGVFNPVSGSFTTTRSWATGAFSDLTTSVTLATTPGAATLAFSATNQTVTESAGTATINVTITNPNNAQIVFSVGAAAFSNATAGTDYTLSAQPIVVPANTSITQTVTITITNDAVSESDEYIALTFTQLYNATASATAAHFLYIRDNDTPAPTASNELFLDLLGSFSNGSNATNSAEIVVHDPLTQRLYIANSIGAKLDIINFSNPAAPVLISSIPVTTYGNINSVAVNDSVVALAIENSTNPQDSGRIVFLDYNGVFISQVKTAAMPDMITFNHAGTRVLAACEGEPNNAYTIDPEGAVAIVDVTGNLAAITQSAVTHITFTSFNGQEAALRAQGIRIYGPGATAAQDFEPEYITISENDQTAWVTLQENNAVAVLNLQTNTVTQLLPLGYKNHNTLGNGMDISDQSAGINLSLFPVKGMYQPDAISRFKIGNQDYLVSANEGDARAYSGLNEESRVSALTLDPTAFPQGAIMKSNVFMGRLNATNRMGDTDNDGDIDEIHVYGSRSFSIWNATTGAQVFDSGDQLERITSTHPVFGAMFNASNSTSATAKNRSDDKGPEPEGTATAVINGETYAFIALERIGGVMMYNVTNPAAPVYVGYYNNRSVATNGPDRGSEGIIFISAAQSPNGQPLVILANETSSTLTIFQVTTCAQRAGVAITPASPAPVCQGNTQVLTGTNVANTTYQWQLNGGNIAGETNNSYTANASGSYQLFITNTTNACSGKTPAVNFVVNPLPVVTASTSNATICAGASTTLSSTGADSYNWMPGNLSGPSLSVTPATTTTYSVTGTNTVTGCTNTATVTVTVNGLPVVTASAANASICVGASTTLNGTGADSYNWMPGNLSGASLSVTPSTTTTYSVTGTNTVTGCSNTATVTVTVNGLPTVTATTANPSICAGASTTISGSGANTYTWQPGNLSGASLSVTPSTTTTYSVTGTNTVTGCSNTSTVTITVNGLPTVTASAANASICVGASTTLNGSGANTYTWQPGNLSGTSISVTPATTTTYSVTGTNTVTGCSNTATVSVTVNGLPTVTATTANPSICAGASTTISGSGANTYTWQPGNLSGASLSVTPATTTTYSVTGTNTLTGCSNTSTVTITVNGLPTVTASAANASICAGAVTTISSSGADSYNWQPGNLSGASLSVTPSSTTTYSVTGTNTVTGCTNTATVSVTVNALPSITATASNSAVCNGNPVTLTVAGGNTYNWMPGNVSGASVSVNPSATTTYSVTGTNTVTGCSNTATLTINVSATPTVSITSPGTTICAGSNTTLNGSGATTYNWQPGNLSGASVTVNPSTTTTYTMTGTNAAGCSSTSTITVTALPRPAITASANNSTICSGNQVTMTATGGNTYTWLPGLLTGPVVTPAPASSVTYTVTGVGSNGCNNTATVAITVNASPVVNATASQTALCGADSVTFTASGAATYTWMPGNISSSSFTQVQNATTTFTLTGVSANGCSDSTNITIVVNNIPSVSAVISTDTLCINSAPAQLTGTPAGGVFSGNGVNGSLFDPALAQSGTHPVVYAYTDANGCEGTDTLTVFVDVCTDNYNVVINDVSLYPNPFSDRITIQAGKQIERVEIFDLNGKLLQSEPVWRNAVELNTEMLPAGVYLTRIYFNDSVSVIKLSRI